MKNVLIVSIFGILGLLFVTGCHTENPEEKYSGFDDLVGQLNQSANIEFDHSFTSVKTLHLLDDLAATWRRQDFKGELIVVGHCGHFAVVSNAEPVKLAPDSIPLGQCDFFPTMEFAYALEDRMAYGVKNYLVKLGIPSESIHTQTASLDSTVFNYPPIDSTAGEWNRAAQKNNCVQIKLVRYRQPEPQLSSQDLSLPGGYTLHLENGLMKDYTPWAGIKIYHGENLVFPQRDSDNYPSSWIYGGWIAKDSEGSLNYYKFETHMPGAEHIMRPFKYDLSDLFYDDDLKLFMIRVNATNSTLLRCSVLTFSNNIFTVFDLETNRDATVSFEDGN